MESTHPRDGEKALLRYDASTGPELADPLDPTSATGNTCFVVTELDASEAGVDDHLEQATASWEEFPALGPWMGGWVGGT